MSYTKLLIVLEKIHRETNSTRTAKKLIICFVPDGVNSRWITKAVMSGPNYPGGNGPGGGRGRSWSPLPPYRPSSPYGPSPPPRLPGSPGMPMFAARVPYVPCPRPRWPVGVPYPPPPPISPSPRPYRSPTPIRQVSKKIFISIHDKKI